MSRPHRIDVARAQAEQLVAKLSPACTRIEIAGSIRRESSWVKDVELVCVPRLERDLFGLPAAHDELRPLVDRLVRDGDLVWRQKASAAPGRRFYPLVAGELGIPVDLFAVLPPAQWGAIFAIRTGPAAFSQHLVTVCQSRGLRCREGRLEHEATGSPVPTPEEGDFFRACGVHYIEPAQRQAFVDTARKW